MDRNDACFEYLCRLGDNTLVLGHRLSEWCGHAPVLEEDIAVANIALDLIGQTQLWLGLAGEVEGKGRTANDLAMLRDVWEFRNLLLVEQPNGDYGQTMVRQFLFDAWHVELLAGLEDSAEPRIAGIAAKTVKEVRYHVERSAGTVIGLGDGTDESHGRMQRALELLWPYVGEMFDSDDVDAELEDAGIAPSLSNLRRRFSARVREVLAEATLIAPDAGFAHSGGKSGTRHSENLGHLLAQMQWLQRAYPGARW